MNLGSNAYFSRYSNKPRLDVLQLLRDHGNWSVAFEIGCGAGATLAELHKRKIIKSSYGVELERSVIKHARPEVTEIFIADVENVRLDLPVKPDLILMLDVLEHLKDPWSVIDKYVDMLQDGGNLVVSIPNVANISILKNLILNDRWDYTNSGLLDRTHLRFFTRKSFFTYFFSVHKELRLVAESVNTFGNDSIPRKVLKLLLPKRFTAIQFLFLFEKTFRAAS